MILTTIIGLQLAMSQPNPIIKVQNSVPNIDATRSCRAEASGGLYQQDFDTCLKSEQAAREQLVKDWAGFIAGDRTTCSGLSNAGGQSTYTELLTCLEIMRDARRLSRDNATLRDDPLFGMQQNGSRGNPRRNGRSNPIDAPTNLGVPDSTVGRGTR
jgi:hypothetical protein